MNSYYLYLKYVCVAMLVFIGMTHIKAQNTIAADFTITDYLNNTVSLYEDFLDEGQTVVLDIFFTTCPPCNAIAPDLKVLYEEWGSGAFDVEFIALSNQSFDDNVDVAAYSNYHQHTYPGAGQDGGSLQAVAPYVNGDYGTFFGTPTFVVIAPDGTVDFNVRGPGNAGTIQALDAAIAATGAVKPSPVSFNGIGKVEAGTVAQDSVRVQLRIYRYPHSEIPFNLQNPILFQETMTDQVGFYEFNVDSLPSTHIVIAPIKEDSIEHYVSTVDILFMRRHLLDRDTLPPDILEYCADVDGSGFLSTIDILELRRLLLDKVDNFPNNDPWRFSPAEIEVIDPRSNGPYNFKMYKTGDCSGDFNTY